MPIYEYSCAKCGKTIEVIQKMSDKPLKKHEGCGGTLTKLISAAGFQFRGTGWYVTDYARKGQNQADSPKTEPKETSASENKEGSADKPAAAKTAKKDSATKSGSSKD